MPDFSKEPWKTALRRSHWQCGFILLVFSFFVISLVGWPGKNNPTTPVPPMGSIATSKPGSPAATGTPTYLYVTDAGNDNVAVFRIH